MTTSPFGASVRVDYTAKWFPGKLLQITFLAGHSDDEKVQFGAATATERVRFFEMHRDRIPGPDWRGFLVDAGGTFAGNHVKNFFDTFCVDEFPRSYRPESPGDPHKPSS